MVAKPIMEVKSKKELKSSMGANPNIEVKPSIEVKFSMDVRSKMDTIITTQVIKLIAAITLLPLTIAAVIITHTLTAMRTMSHAPVMQIISAKRSSK